MPAAVDDELMTRNACLLPACLHACNSRVPPRRRLLSRPLWNFVNSVLINGSRAAGVMPAAADDDTPVPALLGGGAHKGVELPSLSFDGASFESATTSPFSLTRVSEPSALETMNARARLWPGARRARKLSRGLHTAAANHGSRRSGRRRGIAGGAPSDAESRAAVRRGGRSLDAPRATEGLGGRLHVHQDLGEREVAAEEARRLEEQPHLGHQRG